ncbi:MAG: hypothetical protein WCH39_19705, partial [Schlesneria sp.]
MLRGRKARRNSNLPQQKLGYAQILESRTMLSADIAAGGLTFHTTGSWTKSGNVYSDSVATDTITVGYPNSSALIQLGGTVRVDTTSTSPTFSATGNVSAIISGTTIPIVTGGVSSQSVSQLIGSSGLTALKFQPFTVAGVNFNPSSIALNKTNNSIQLQGSVAFDGVTVNVSGSNNVLINSSGVSLTGVSASVASGSITLGSLSFSTSNLSVAYTSSTQQFQITGDSTVNVTGLGSVSAHLGGPNGGTTTGLTVTNGTLTSFQGLVDLNSTIAGGKLTSSGDLFSYSSLTSNYTVTGNAVETFGTGSSAKTLSLKLGSKADTTNNVPETTGLVISNGVLTSLTAKATATGWSIAGGKFNSTALVTYASVGDTLTVTGNATEVFGTGTSQKSLSLILGSDAVAATATTVAIPATTGLVISGGTLTSLTANATASNWSISGVQLNAIAVVTYASATNGIPETLTFSGNGSVTFGGVDRDASNNPTYLSVTLGHNGSPGLVIQNGNVQSLDLTVNSSFKIGGVNFSTIPSNGMEFKYAASNDTFSMTGGASVTFTGLDSGSSLSVTFGNNGNPGLVIANGNLEVLDLTVSSNFKVGGVTFTASGLEFKYLNNSQTLVGGVYTGTYNANQYVFAMYGT